MFNKSKKNTEPVPKSPEETYSDKLVLYGDGWSTIEVDTPGDTIDLWESDHKYLRNPLLNPSGSLMLRGQDDQGNHVRLFFLTGEFGVIEQTSPEGNVTFEAMLVDTDDMNLQNRITIGQPYELPDGDRFAVVTGIAADYKYGSVGSDKEVAGPSPFRQADDYLRHQFPGLDSGDLTPRAKN